MSSSTESWRQSLATIRAQLSDLTASDTPLAGVYGVYSPDPMRQQQDLPQVDDFRELSLGPVFRRKEDVSPRVLHQDQRKVEALYYTSDVWASRYPEIATGLLNIVFRDEEHARQLLGFTGVSDVTPVDLWTILLFRLATQRLDGTGLFPRNSANAGDVYQTLWPVATKGPNACDPISLPDGSSPSPLWLPQIYYGSLWVLNEARGTILLEPHSEQPVNLTECTLRFSPPLVLFGTSHTNEQPPQLPPLVYYAWGEAQGEFPTVAVLNADGSPLPDFDAKRICGIRTCFLSSAGAADDYGNGYYCSQDRPDVSASLSGSAGIFEVKRDYPLAKITTTRFEIPLNINFLACDEAENVRLVIWPQDPVENRSIGYHYFSDENLCMPDLHDCLSFQPSPREYFVLKNFPLLQTKYNNGIRSRLIRLFDAEAALDAIRQAERQLSLPMVDDQAVLLPQQRIMNAVQILDNLPDASDKAIGIVLDKGREWVWQNVERTAPVFAEAWSEGLFSHAECQRLVTCLRDATPPSFVASAIGQAMYPRPKKTKTMRDYSEEEKWKMIALALEYVRKFPFVNKTIIAHLVARKYEEFRNDHLSRFGKGECFSKHFQNEAARIQDEYRGCKPSDVVSTTPEDIAKQNEINDKLNKFCESNGIPTDNIEARNTVLDKRCKKSDFKNKMFQAIGYADID